MARRVFDDFRERRRSKQSGQTLPRTAGDRFEQSLWARGYLRIAGIDEAGRGPLAGPVVAAAVILPEPSPGRAVADMLAAIGLTGLDDSKRLSALRRETLADAIVRHCASGVAVVPAEAIDRDNIRAASLRAMRLALRALPLAADFALVDGRDVPEGLECPAEAIVAGDHLSISIAAASILAKVVRDTIMTAAATDFPGYGFERHAGYPTQAHRAALAAHGPCPLHRLSFAPVRKRDTEKIEG